MTALLKKLLARLRPFFPGTVFGLHAVIGRKQFAFALLYMGIVAATFASIIDAVGSGLLSALIGLAGYAVAVSLMTLAIRNRLSDAGMSHRWLGVLVLFFFIKLVQSISGDSSGPVSWLSPGGLSRLSTISVTAMLLVLLIARSTSAPRPLNDNASIPRSRRK